MYMYSFSALTLWLKILVVMKIFVSYYKLDVPAYIFTQESSIYCQIIDNTKCTLDNM